MPNRILKESICVSDSINALDWFEEVLFYRLMVNCDDFGRFDGRMAVIKNRLFPLKEEMTLEIVTNGIQRLVGRGLIQFYEFEGKPYLFLTGWNDHQTIRARKSKYPVPVDGETEPAGNCKQMQADEFNCKQMQADEFNCKQMQADEINCKQMFPESESESNSKSESESNAGDSGGDDASCRKAPPQEKLAFGEYGNVYLTAKQYDDLREEFPDLERRIQRLGAYMESTGKKYRSHYATIREWAKRDRPKPRSDTPSSWSVGAVEKMMKGG